MTRPSSGAQMPPHSLDAEGAVLSAILLDASGAMLDEIRALVRPEAFFSRANGMIFEAVCALADRGSQIDAVTVLQLLRDQGRADQIGGAPYLAQLIDATPAVANVQEHSRILREHHRVRQAVHLAQRIAAEGHANIGADAAGVQKWLEGCEASIAELVHVHEERTLAPMSVVMDETAAMLDAIKSGGSAGVSTGFTEVDAQTSGLHDGDFYIVAARPGVGKSAYALSMAMCIALAGYAVPFFSIEMPRVQLGSRLVAMDARVDLKRMREQAFPLSERLKADASMLQLRALPLFIDDSAVITPFDVKARVKRIQHEIAGGKHPSVTKGRIGGVFIDYLQLMRPTRDTHSREQDVASIGRELKILAKTLGVPVIALCQLNRDVEKRVDKRPQLSDLRECLAGDTEIFDPKTGRLTRIDALRAGAWVLALNTTTLKLEPVRCERVMRTGKRKLVRVTTRTGRSVRLTPCHPVLTLEGWKPIGKLASGEAFAVPRSYGTRTGRSSSLTPDRARLLGYLVSNGSYKRHRSVSVTMPEQAVLRDAGRIAKSFEGIRPRLHKHWSGTDSLELTVPHGYGPGKNPIINWLRALGIHGHGTTEKVTPGVVLTGSLDVLRNYLAGLFTGDGTVVRRKNGGWVVKYTSTSMRLLAQVQHLLLRIGVLSQVSPPERNTKSTVDIATLRISERSAIARFAELVPVRGQKGSKLLRAGRWSKRGKENAQLDRLPLPVAYAVDSSRRLLGLTHHTLGYRFQKKRIGRGDLLRVADALEKASGQQLEACDAFRRLALSDLLWDTVRSVEPAGLADVYDLVVPRHHCFVANDIVVHNSGALEQEADAIQFLYRPSYYDRGKSPDPALKGWAEIIVAKQRNGPTGTRRVAFREDCTRFDNLQPGDVGIYDAKDEAVRRDWHRDSDDFEEDM